MLSSQPICHDCTVYTYRLDSVCTAGSVYRISPTPYDTIACSRAFSAVFKLTGLWLKGQLIASTF